MGRVKVRDRVEVRVGVRVRIMVSANVSLNKNNSGAGELTDKYHYGFTQPNGYYLGSYIIIVGHGDRCSSYTKFTWHRETGAGTVLLYAKFWAVNFWGNLRAKLKYWALVFFSVGICGYLSKFCRKITIFCSAYIFTYSAACFLVFARWQPHSRRRLRCLSASGCWSWCYSAYSCWACRLRSAADLDLLEDELWEMMKTLEWPGTKWPMHEQVHESSTDHDELTPPPPTSDGRLIFSACPHHIISIDVKKRSRKNM